VPQVIELPDGQELEFPDGMTDEQIKAAIDANADKLGIQKKGQTSDLFRDTARPLAYEMGGGIIGGAIPAALAPATGGLSALAIPLGVGLGAAAGSELENIIATWGGQRVDERGLPERLTDAAVTTGVNAVGMRAGELLAQGARRVLHSQPVQSLANRVLRRRPQATLGDFEALGIQPTAGQASGSRFLTTAESALSDTPGGATALQEATERALGQLDEAASNTARGFGPAHGTQETGGTIKSAAKAASDRYAARRIQLDEAVEAKIGKDTRVPVKNAETLRAELQAELAKGSKSERKRLDAAIQELDDVLADAGDQGIPFSTLRKIRTRLGQDLDRPDSTGYLPGAQDALRKVWGAVRDDIRAAAEANGAKRELGLHDRYVRFNREVNLPTLDKIEKFNADEEAYKFAVGQMKEGGSRLMTLRRNFRPQEWDEVASTVVDRLGRSGADDEFSAARFLTQYGKMAPEARNALFSGTRYEAVRPDLDRLVRVSEAIKKADSVKNYSNTAKTLIYALGGAGFVGNLYEGDTTGAVKTVAAAVVAPRVAAKLMTSPNFVRWAANAASMVKDNPNSLTAHLGRLVAITEAEPELKQDVAEYLKAVRGQSNR
jgi:hypothetical protein